MTCEDNVPDRTRCKQCGAKYILAMPVDPVQLQEKVRQFLKVPQRQAFRVILSVSVDGKFNDRPFLCFTENISATGALIKSELDLSLRDCISCSFYMPDGTQINTQGEIVRVFNKTGFNATFYGIRFTNIPAESQAKIEAFVQKERAKMIASGSQLISHT
jgi:c-di-GMP-binding flagellar brake protein YcgR